MAEKDRVIRDPKGARGDSFESLREPLPVKKKRTPATTTNATAYGSSTSRPAKAPSPSLSSSTPRQERPLTAAQAAARARNINAATKSSRKSPKSTRNAKSVKKAQNARSGKSAKSSKQNAKKLAAAKSATVAAATAAPLTAEKLASLPPPTPKPRHAVRATRATATATKTAKHRRGVKITIIAVCAILVLTIAGIVALVWSLNERLNDLDIGDLLGGDRPASASASSTVRNPGDPFSGRAVNIVVMGTDSRQGAAGAYSGDGDEVEGMRADTTFIAHISADRTRVDALSIPRDTFITIPECVLPDGELVPEAGWTEQGFNAAFASGAFTGDVGAGAACAIRAIEEMTDVRMDGFVVVDFAGFAQIVDAIGGVDICLSEAIDSPDADNLVLPAGFNHLTGALATQYARARTGDGTGDGSDLGRIDRQQVLFTAIARKALSLNIVSDFPKLYDFIGSVMDAVTTDIGGIADLAGFAYSLRNLDMAEINFYTVPITDAWDGAHVELETEEAAPFFEALSTDVPMATAVTPDEDVHHNSDVNGFEPVEPTSSVMPTWEPPDPDATVSIDPRCQ